MLLQRLHDIHGWHWVRRSHEWQLAPVRVAERAELVAVRDAGGDAVEVERVGALGREDGLPPAGADAAEADSARILLDRKQIWLRKQWATVPGSIHVE
jgi:hypothetical protein